MWLYLSLMVRSAQKSTERAGLDFCVPGVSRPTLRKRNRYRWPGVVLKVINTGMANQGGSGFNNDLLQTLVEPVHLASLSPQYAMGHFSNNPKLLLNSTHKQIVSNPDIYGWYFYHTLRCDRWQHVWTIFGQLWLESREKEAFLTFTYTLFGHASSIALGLSVLVY